VLSLSDALEQSKGVGFDLVEIASDSEPPVCKIMDHGRHLYNQSKKVHEARKNQKTIQTKEIKMRCGIESHDLEFKMRNAKKFLLSGNKIRITISFKGREISHTELGRDLLNRVLDGLQEEGNTEMRPRMEGKSMVAMLAPKSSKS